MTEPQFEKLDESHREPVIDIFNYYILNDYSAYLESQVSYDFYNLILDITRGYPALAIRDASEGIAGYAFLKSHNQMPVFRRTAELTIFLRHGYTGKGIGGMLLARLESEAKGLGISVLMASISSLNEYSIRFHEKQGFLECGRFKRIGVKFSREFDVVWMQKFL
ncbi:MAG: N-acetyltransferase [Spirochaetes bacterium]|nr:N-acetyltransferase [Spirochaetota bacterium]